MAARIVLGLAVAVLAAVVLWAAAGQLPRLVSSIGDALGGFAGNLFASPSPTPKPVTIIPPPNLRPPTETYTRLAAVDITGTVDPGIAGLPGYTVRLYVALPDQAPAIVKEVPVGETPAFVVTGVPLETGRNDITATLAGPAGESDPSRVITINRDISKPKVTITAPKNGATINRPTVKITGKTQGRSEINARNDANGAVGTTTAKADGTFSVTLALADGSNAITVTATDLAHNTASTVVTVRKGSGKLALALTASTYQLSAATLPRPVTLTALVTDPDGKPISGATVSFSLTIPGVAPITGEARTNNQGKATYRTIVPDGATIGGTATGTALVDTSDFGSTSDRINIAIKK
jgi:hypothetical protein